jgi:hypothetical protein
MSRYKSNGTPFLYTPCVAFVPVLLDLPLPRYYKTTIYTDDQRQLLWLYAEDKGVKWVKGFEVIGANTVNKDYYERLLKEKNENGIGLHEDKFRRISKWINRIKKHV